MPSGLNVKSFFFDRTVVTDAVDRATRKALSRTGAFVRTRARSSLRKRKAVSAAGSPPSMHEGSLKRLLFFSYDPASKSVVIGPAKFKSGNVPRLLEFGGRVTRVRKGKTVQMNYAPRPYMGPALEAEVAAGTIPDRWAGSVSR